MGIPKMTKNRFYLPHIDRLLSRKDDKGIPRRTLSVWENWERTRQNLYLGPVF